MSLHSIATAGLRTIDQIPYQHDLRFHRQQNGLAITIELTTSSLSGAPVVDDKGTFIGFISEFDILNILESGRDVSQLTAEEIMVQDHVAIHESATLAEAVKLMKHQHLLVLPVERNGLIIGCVSRQDLLRAWIGLGFGQNVCWQPEN
jgi:predicted transcriptional regulator